MSRESILLRGQVWEVDQSVKLGSDGMPSTMIVRGVTPQGGSAETFEISAGVASWKSPVDAGNHRYTSPAFYISQGGTYSEPKNLPSAVAQTGMGDGDKPLTAQDVMQPCLL